MDGIAKRGGKYIPRKRVPGRYASVEPRTIINHSLATDSMDVAKSKATRVWAQMIEAWEARLAGDISDAEARFKAAKNLAEARGYRFMATGDVAKMPLPLVLDRVKDALA